MTITHTALDLTIWEPPHPDMFKHVQFGLIVQPPHSSPAPHMVGKQAVRILLECFLVIFTVNIILIWFRFEVLVGAWAFVLISTATNLISS